MKVAIVGLGQFGMSLATRLGRSGVEVIAIDIDMERVDDVKSEVSVAVRLDATDERDLRAQGVDQVDVIVAAMGEQFEANQLVVVLAKRFGIPRVIARATSPMHERILRLIGADDVILPEVEASDKVAQGLARPSLKAYFEVAEGYSIAEVTAPPAFHNRTLMALDLRKNYGVNLIAVKRVVEGRESVNPVPLPSDVIHAGDVLAVAGPDESLEKLIEEAQEGM